MKRRTLLAAGTAAAALPLTGCAGGDDALEVVCAWGGPELAAFRRVLAGFTARTRHPVRIVVANGNGVDAMLSARLAAGNRPDVAVFSEPSLITRYASGGHLVKLSTGEELTNPGERRTSQGGSQDQLTATWEALTSPWQELVTVGGTLYGCWLKVAHKSLFWYRQSALFPAPGHERLLEQRPQTWDELVELVRRWPVRGTAPLAIGAADGWVLTDWFENVLASLSTSGQTGSQYALLADPLADWDVPLVRSTLHRLGQLWSLPGALPYGGARALLTPFDASVAQVFGERRAGLLCGADFVAPVVADLHTDQAMSYFTFPAANEQGKRPQVVGGDVAVLLRDSEPGRSLMTYLTTRPAAVPWANAGFLVAPYPANRDIDYPVARLNVLAADLNDPTAELQFDLSDQLTGKLIGDDGKGSWLILSDFFRAVTGGGSIDRAVDDAVRRFDAAVGRSR